LLAQAGGLVKLAELAATEKNAGAAERFTTAIRSLEALQAKDPQNLHTLSLLGFTLTGLGQTLIERQSTDEALRQLQRSASIYTALLTKDPDNIAWGNQLVESLARISQIQIEREQYGEAESNLARCVKTSNHLVSRHPDTVPSLLAASTCQSRLALLVASRDDEDSVWFAAHTELTILRAQIAALAPEDPSRQDEWRVARDVLVDNLAKSNAPNQNVTAQRLRSAGLALQTTLPEAAAMLRSLGVEVGRK